MRSRRPKRFSKPYWLHVGSITPKTHNLRFLVELLAGENIRLPAELAEIDRLTQFGTTFRYDTTLSAAATERAIWLGHLPSR